MLCNASREQTFLTSAHLGCVPVCEGGCGNAERGTKCGVLAGAMVCTKIWVFIGHGWELALTIGVLFLASAFASGI